MSPLTVGVGNLWLIEGPTKGRDAGQLGRSGACGVGSRGTPHAAWPSGVLHRVSQGVQGIRRLGGRLSTGLHEPECAEQARRARHGGAVDIVRPQALCPHAALRADGVLPGLLGLTRVVSEDAVRRGLKAIPECEGS